MRWCVMGNDSRPRVLHLRVCAGTGGGPEKTILNSPRFIQAEGFDASVAYLCPPGDPIRESLRDRAAAANCPLYLLDDHGPFDVRLISRVTRLCRELKIDILQAHDYKSNVLAWCVRKWYRCRLVTMLHGWTDMSGRMPLYKRIDQFFLRYFESLICVSPDLVEECERLRIPKQRLHHVPNAIDVEHFRRRLDPISAKEAIQARPDRFLIGSVGRLSQEKGFDRLIQAVVLLQQQGLPLDLWIAGDGPEREELTRIIGQHTTDGSIRLLGQMADLRMFYQAMDLFVLNSTREGLPNVLLEALALETPSIATRVGGVPDLIKPGRTGYLIEPQDDLELVQSIQRAISSPELGAEMAAAGRKNIVERFGFDARMKKIATIYRDMLEKSTRWTSKSK